MYFILNAGDTNFNHSLSHIRSLLSCVSFNTNWNYSLIAINEDGIYLILECAVWMVIIDSFLSPQHSRYALSLPINKEQVRMMAVKKKDEVILTPAFIFQSHLIWPTQLDLCMMKKCLRGCGKCSWTHTSSSTRQGTCLPFWVRQSFESTEAGYAFCSLQSYGYKLPASLESKI